MLSDPTPKTRARGYFSMLSRRRLLAASSAAATAYVAYASCEKGPDRFGLTHPYRPEPAAEGTPQPTESPSPSPRSSSTRRPRVLVTGFHDWRDLESNLWRCARSACARCAHGVRTVCAVCPACAVTPRHTQGPSTSTMPHAPRPMHIQVPRQPQLPRALRRAEREPSHREGWPTRARAPCAAHTPYTTSLRLQGCSLDGTQGCQPR